MAVSTFVRVLDEDPEMAAAVPKSQRDAVRVRAVAPLLALGVGLWEPPTTARSPGADLGLIVLAGLLTRDFELAGRSFTELRGPEDILRPWDDAREATSVNAGITWKAIAPTRLAWLNGDFAAAVAPFPKIPALLIERAVRRARLLSFRLAIAELKHVHLRVLLLLWHLSDRWGRVRPDGVHLDLPLTHSLIGRMVGAHRTSVTGAVQRLAKEGRIARSHGESWVLLGAPPDDLNDL
jgi:CRP/FNR family transcriptional regulator, cyclic AMP receptor protein